jgi:hypothetical protein
MKVAITTILFILCSGFVTPAQRLGPDVTSDTILENEYVKVKQTLVTDDLDFSFQASDHSRIVLFIPGPGVEVAGGPKIYMFGSVRYIPRRRARKIARPLGCDPIWEIVIEFKAPPPKTAFADDAVKLDPKHNEVLFESESARVVRVHFGLEESGPMVDKRPRVIILLTDTHAQVRRPDGQLSPRDSTAGAIQWSLGGRQATINGNVGRLDNIVVELKGSEAKGK